VPRYLSPEWVESFDAALGALDLTEAIAAAGTGSLLATDGAFTVAQVVEGDPDAAGADRGGSTVRSVRTVRTVLTIAEGHAHLALDPDGAASDAADVTMLLGYDDALAMAQGALQPADALAAGRVRVRGDLSALVAAQSVLQAASAMLGPALTELTESAGAHDPADPAS
jgi:SCP-2 sterol transfer family